VQRGFLFGSADPAHRIVGDGIMQALASYPLNLAALLSIGESTYALYTSMAATRTRIVVLLPDQELEKLQL
jgi:hypothetical protein